MRIAKLAAVTMGLALAMGAAHAQQSGGPGTPNLVGSENSPDLRGPDETGRNIDNARNEAVRNNAASSRSNRAVPAKPSDVIAGSEVRDSKGVVLGTIDSLGAADAVVAAAGGKVAVPLESFGKNNKGLLLPVTKAQFDAMVADANKTGK